MMRDDLWRGSGFQLLTKDAAGYLTVTDDFLRAYLLRPELLPPEDASLLEQHLHRRLMDDPRIPLTSCGLADLEDPDAAANMEVFLLFRDRLLAAGSIEAAYRGLFGGARFSIPPLFVDQLAHVIMRNLLDSGCTALEARAAELFFRSQRVTLKDGHVMLADEETVESYAATGGLGNIGRLLVENQTPTKSVELDVLTLKTQEIYWPRSDRFDTVIDISFPQPGLDAFCRVTERWLAHFHGIDMKVEPVQAISDEQWRWHSGLDAVSSGLLDALYRGEEVAPERMMRLLALFRLTIPGDAGVIEEMRGRPVYLGLAVDEHGRLHMKPQNLLVNLPLQAAS